MHGGQVISIFIFFSKYPFGGISYTLPLLRFRFRFFCLLTQTQPHNNQSDPNKIFDFSIFQYTLVSIWFPVVDVGKEDDLADHGGQGVDPGHSKHQAKAQEGRDQGNPLVVIFKRWPPARGLGIVRKETGHVHQTIRSKEEVRCKYPNCVKVC